MPATTIDRPVAAAELVAQFLTALRLEHGRAAHTCASYRTDLGLFVGWLEQEGIDPLELDRVDAARYVDSLTGSHATRRRRVASLRRFYQHLLLDERVERDPTSRIRTTAGPQRLPEVLSEEEIARLFAVVKGDGWLSIRDRALLELMYACGLRASEVCGLELVALNLQAATLRVVGKGERERLLPIGQPAVEALDAWLTVRPASAQTVFVNRHGTRLSRQGLHKMLRARGRAVGVDLAVDHTALSAARYGGGPCGVQERAPAGGGRMTWPEAIGHFHRDVRLRGLTQNTTRNYMADVENFAAFANDHGGVTPEAVRVRVPRAWVAFMAENGAAPATISRRLSSIRVFYRALQDLDLVDDSPVPVMRRSKPVRLPRTLTQTEARELLEGSVRVPGYSRRFELRDRALLELAYSSALRVSEICGLNIDDLEGDLVRVRDGKGGPYGGPRERLAPVGDYAQDAIAAYLASRLVVRRDEPLFLSRTGRRLDHTQVRRIVKVWAAGLPGKVTPHTLRHSCATHLLDGGASLEHIRRVLGHTSLATTELYLRVSPTHRETAYQAHPRATTVQQRTMTTKGDGE